MIALSRARIKGHRSIRRWWGLIMHACPGYIYKNTGWSKRVPIILSSRYALRWLSVNPIEVESLLSRNWLNLQLCVAKT